MTRINTVDPVELCDQHLLSEYRELPRIPNAILKGRIKNLNIPEKYTVRTNDSPKGGEGHMKFFIYKLDYLYWRYKSLFSELRSRGFKPKDQWPYDIADMKYAELWGTWKPDQEAINLNRKRIREMMPARPRYAGRYVIM